VLHILQATLGGNDASYDSPEPGPALYTKGPGKVKFFASCRPAGTSSRDWWYCTHYEAGSGSL